MSLPRNVGSRLRGLESIYEIIKIFRDCEFRDLGNLGIKEQVV